MIKYPWSLDGKPPPPEKRSRWYRFQRHLPGISVGLMLFGLVAAILYPYMVITVPSGQVGVLWKRINGFGVYCFCWVGRGTVLNPLELREEGLHVIWPWDKLFLYDLRLQTVKETYNAISSDGVSLTATISIRFQVKHNSVAVLHKYIGPGYIASVVKPEIGSRAREVISGFTAEEVYSIKRQQIEDDIRKNAQEKLGDHLNQLVQIDASEQADRAKYVDQLKNAIGILDTLILGIELPKTIVGAINRKTEQYYLIQEYAYRVLREEKESQRKQIEANGIAAFQRTVSDGISDSYLRWRGIEATLQLAQSNNSKIVVIGNKDGLPLILGNVDTPSATPRADKPADGDTAADDKDKDKEKTPGAAGDKASSTTPDGTSADDATGEPAKDKPAAKGKKADKKSGKDESRSVFGPLEFDSFLARLAEVLRGKESGTDKGAPASEKPAAAEKPAAN
jgi:regulator of protease activity HflC (stomatin/prohibitin superfamily)